VQNLHILLRTEKPMSDPANKELMIRVVVNLLADGRG
jgi:hypothetical protein